MAKRERLDTEEPVNLGGRPTKYNSDPSRLLSFSHAAVCSQEEITDCLGIDSRTLRRWLLDQHNCDHRDQSTRSVAGRTCWNHQNVPEPCAGGSDVLKWGGGEAQGLQGAAEHLRDPSRVAWNSMCATDEGHERGSGWCRKAIWGNTPQPLSGIFSGAYGGVSADLERCAIGIAAA